MEVARAFRYGDLTREYGAIISKHEQSGLTEELENRYNNANRELLNRIRTDYGEMVAQNVEANLRPTPTSRRARRRELED